MADLSIVKTESKSREICDKLYYDFMHSMQTHFSGSEIFSTIADFIQNCNDTLEMMKGLQTNNENVNISNDYIALENERNTWSLIHCLYQFRLNAMNSSSEIANEYSTYISEKDMLENIYKTEPLITECQLIVDWLEKNALDQANNLPSVEYFTDKTIGWENTIYEMHSNLLDSFFASSRPLVSSLDPDAPVREKKALHDLDKEDDARLEKRMFFEVRCGHLQKARNLAIHCGQPWRAACLLGWVPYHDPNYTNSSINDKLPVEGNPNRTLWKLCAWKQSQDKRVGNYYRAIYASLCGNLNQLLSVASSWQDGLWAFMKTILDIQVEHCLQGLMPNKYTKMPDEYWNNKLSLEEVFDELHSSKNPIINGQANMPEYVIQKFLILNHVSKLMKEVQNMVEMDNCNPQFLRFLAHLILVLRQINIGPKDEIGNKVLLSYVRTLTEIGDPMLVAFYTATLLPDDRIKKYAKYLENITENEQRKKCLRAAEDANLNVEAITKLVVENVRSKNCNIDTSSLKEKTTAADLEKISALDWLLFYPTQREELLWQTNALIRYFLTNDNIDAARQAFNKIPEDSINAIMSEYPNLADTIANLSLSNNLSKRASSAIREYLCYQTYLDAQEGFTEWFTHFHQRKPAPLPNLSQYASFTDKVAYDHKKAQYNVELERWKCTMQHRTKAVKSLLYNVLIFPDGGWLNNDEGTSGQVMGSDDDMYRERQMEELRKTCIPKITLLLYCVMSEMNEHESCLELADVLATEQYQLYKVFPKDVLQDILKKLCDSSLKLMNQMKDPWGYPK